MADDEKTTKSKTLTDDDVVTQEGRSYGRRNTVGMLGVGGVGAAVALATGCGYARRRRIIRASVQTGITDSDAGRACADPGGRGRGPTGVTDSDNSGYCRNQVGRGRAGGGQQVVVQQSTGITDSDGGPCADPGGGGRGYSGLTDSDGGACADPGGRGRTGY